MGHRLSVSRREYAGVDGRESCWQNRKDQSMRLQSGTTASRAMTHLRSGAMPKLSASMWTVRASSSGVDVSTPMLPADYKNRPGIAACANKNMQMTHARMCSSVGAGTILENDSLDMLGEYMGKGAEVADLTNQAMDGSMNLEQVHSFVTNENKTKEQLCYQLCYLTGCLQCSPCSFDTCVSPDQHAADLRSPCLYTCRHLKGGCRFWTVLLKTFNNSPRHTLLHHD